MSNIVECRGNLQPRIYFSFAVCRNQKTAYTIIDCQATSKLTWDQTVTADKWW